MPPIVSRNASLLGGGTKYFTGVPCGKGHIAERWNASKACVACSRESNSRYYTKHKDAHREKGREYRRAYPEKDREARRKWRSANLEKARESSRRSALRHYEKRLAYRRKFDGYPDPTRPCPEVCECCGGKNGNRKLNLDHDHVTGAFRGWICGKCNIGIGLLGDSPEGLEQALKYLRVVR